MQRPDEVALEDVYAAATLELRRIQERLILANALIARLKREVNDGQTDKGNAGHDGGEHTAHHFSD